MRRSAEDRRAEIVTVAARIALTGGLDEVTLRSVAQQIGITNALVSHYFGSVDDLLAEVFAVAAGAELTETYAIVEAQGTPIDGLRTLLALLVDQARDSISTLWVDAWHAGRRRPALAGEVARQTAAWNGRLAELLRQGADSGDFHLDDPRRSSARIMAAVDGLTVQTVMRGTIDYESVRQLVFMVAESELGLLPGSLRGAQDR